MNTTSTATPTGRFPTAGIVFLLGLAAMMLASCSTTPLAAKLSRYTLVIHGGAGGSSRTNRPPEREAAARATFETALRAGEAVLQTNGTALDAVVIVIKVLEDSPLFNAGCGAVLNREGFCELDAAVMDGATRRAGAVAAVRRVKNPIAAARLVMERTPHVLLAGAGADGFAEKAGLAMVEPDYFITEPRRKQLQQFLEREKARPRADSRSSLECAPGGVGTVGAVAVDRHGHLAAATSTGGLVGKLPGRVGDTPLIGAGTWADDATCAVSATGQGEFFIRAAVAHDIASLMAYRRLPLEKAARLVVKQKLVALGGEGGVIAVDRQGHIAMPYNTAEMNRAFVREGETPCLAISP